jgi:ribosomal protein S18 acetylase RimI-like enzyme
MACHRRPSKATAKAMESDLRHDMVLRTGTEADAAAAAALHAGQISEGFLTILGPRFLQRLYRRIAKAPGSFLLVVEDASTTVGVLAGSTDVAALYRAFVWRDGAAVAFTCGWRLLRSWRRVVETLRHGSGGGGVGAELLAVAVDPVVRRQGVGTLLVEGFLTEIGRRQWDAAYVVVASSNDAATAVYRRAGFRTAERFELHPGTESLVMQWERPPATPSS